MLLFAGTQELRRNSLDWEPFCKIELTAVRGISALQMVTNHYFQFDWFHERKDGRRGVEGETSKMYDKVGEKRLPPWSAIKMALK